jgi:hypothetical protein
MMMVADADDVQGGGTRRRRRRKEKKLHPCIETLNSRSPGFI